MRPLAYILASFPTLTETFVVGEILEIRRRGIPVVLFALRESHSPVQQPEARSLRAEVRYACSLFAGTVVRANLEWALREPARYFHTLWFMVRGSARNPIHLLKTLILFPKAVELADRMVRHGIGHVHAHWATYPTTVAMVISELTGLTYSFTAHAWDVSLIRTLLPEKVRRARFVVTCTKANQAELRAMLPNGKGHKICLNYHGISVERFAHIDRTASAEVPIITSCGALFERKGFVDLIRACGILKRRGRRFRCVIIGEGPQRLQLLALMEAEGVAAEVTLVGAIPQAEVIRHYAQSDLFVLPCLTRSLTVPDPEADLVKALEAWFEGKRSIIRDGIPNVLAEAMAMGMPVVSTRTSGIPELIQDDINGLLVPPRDPAGLARAMERLLVDPGLRSCLGRRAAADVRTYFDREKNVATLAEIFLRHLGEAPVPERADAFSMAAVSTSEPIRDA